VILNSDGLKFTQHANIINVVNYLSW